MLQRTVRIVPRMTRLGHDLELARLHSDGVFVLLDLFKFWRSLAELHEVNSEIEPWPPGCEDSSAKLRLAVQGVGS
jgi:hypothetical protein